MSVAVRNEKRRQGRFSLALSAEVKVKMSRDEIWKQKTEVISFSRSGAGFYFDQKCSVGQLVSLMLPMPKHLRCYGFDKELYRVWGLVQHCSPMPVEGRTTYHVGVAFVGKLPPQSYNENPRQSYRITGINENGTWRVVEAQTTFVVRKHPRFPVELAVFLTSQDENRKPISDEIAKTENISQSGAGVFSNLDVNIGDSVNFECLPFNFSALAVVRNRQTSDEGESKLHLEFIDAAFPIDELCLPDKEDEEDDEFED